MTLGSVATFIFGFITVLLIVTFTSLLKSDLASLVIIYIDKEKIIKKQDKYS